jgi:hypothetical protein
LAKFVQLTFANESKGKVWINFDKVQYFHGSRNYPEDTNTLIYFDAEFDEDKEEFVNFILVAETEGEIYTKLTR